MATEGSRGTDAQGPYVIINGQKVRPQSDAVRNSPVVERNVNRPGNPFPTAANRSTSPASVQGQSITGGNPAVVAPAEMPTGGSTGTSGSGSGSSTDIGSGLDPFTGFASRYTPAMADAAYENPWYILQDVFPGMSESSPLYQALRDMGGDPLTLFNIIAGSQQKIDQGAGDFINWLANMYEQRGTPGGATFNAQDLISTLFGQTEFGADSQNTLGQILGAGDMSTQVRTLFNMLRDVSNVGMNPLAARGYQAAIAQAGDRYGNRQMKADESSTMGPTEWIAQNMPWLSGR